MKPRAPVLLIVCGLVLIVGGFAYDLAFAGLPFQDPTLEMLEDWLFHKRVANRIILSGGGLLGVSCVWAMARWVMRLAGRTWSDT